MDVHSTTVTDRRAIPLLVLVLMMLGALIYLPVLGDTPLHNEETRRALITEHMLITGDYWVPVFMDEIYTAKPPLFNWLIAATAQLHGGLDSFSTRLPSVLALLLVTATLVLGMRRHFSLPGLAFIGLGTLLAPEILLKTNTANIDTTFTALVTASIWSWFWLDQRGHRDLRLWLLPAVLVALAFLAKREPGLVFYYLTIGGYLLYRRRLGELFRWPHLLSAAVTLGLIGIWLGVMIHQIGLQALLDSSLDEVVNRGTSATWKDYAAQFFGYPVRILAATLPFSLFLIPLLVPAVWRQLYRRSPELLTFALIAIAINLPIYLLRAPVAVRYYMPMMPTIVILAALVFDEWYRQGLPRAGRIFTGAVMACLALAGVLAITALLAVHNGLMGRLEPFAPVLPESVVYALPLAILLGVGWALYRYRSAARASAMAAVVVSILAVCTLQLTVLIPRYIQTLEREEDFRTFAQQVYARVPRSELPIQAVGWVPHGFWFAMEYGDVATPHRTGHDLPQNYFVADQAQLTALRDQGVSWQEVASMVFRDGRIIAARVTP